MKPICLLGSREDKLLVYLAWIAEREQLPVRWLDETRLGDDWELRFCDEPLRWTLRADGREHGDADLAGIFVRFDHDVDAGDLFDAGSAEEMFLLTERRLSLQHWLGLVRRPVINRPWAGRENAAKPCQMRQLSDAGFTVPRWIVTNDAVRAERFLETCPQGAVVKSCSGLRAMVQKAGGWIVERLRDGSVPVVLQEYVPGREVRVHVVGAQVFPAEVASSGVDYRFSETPTEYRRTSAPAAVRRRCVRHAREAGLTLSGFDFRVDDAGTWCCLEMNPVPSFLPYELATGLPIGKAVLDELTCCN